MAEYLYNIFFSIQQASLPLVGLFLAFTFLGVALLGYLALFIVAPFPREPLRSEKSFRVAEENGKTSPLYPLPCWHDAFHRPSTDASMKDCDIQEAEVFMSLVIPAYNEEKRLEVMLMEAVKYLQREYDDDDGDRKVVTHAGEPARQLQGEKRVTTNGNSSHTSTPTKDPTGWEILLISDGSTDQTTETALNFARRLDRKSAASIRVVSLQQNRGKGGAVTHGMRHVRGKYAIFADADGASKFEDLGKLMRASQRVQDNLGRSIAVGSRAHLVGSEAVVKRSFLRNLLMHSFHVLLRLLTPPATASIRDTQCGFKLFSRAALPHIIPHMHSEGWIFDVEMLMLAEAAGIPVVEVPVGWKEVGGSKLNVVWDSVGMAWGLAVLRAAWAVGVYKRG